MLHLTALLVLVYTSIAIACTGAEQSGYCCNGAIFRKDHSNSFSADDLICCQGASPEVNLDSSAPTSCTAGTQIPLTQASGGGVYSSPTESSSPTLSSLSFSMGGVSGLPSSAGGASVSVSVSGSDTSSSSGASSNRAMITAVPLLGVAVVAVGGVALAI